MAQNDHAGPGPDEAILSTVRPDDDLVDDLIATINRHATRMTSGNILGSLLVCASAAIHSRNKSQPSPTMQEMRGLVTIVVHFLGRRPELKNPKSVLHLN